MKKPLRIYLCCQQDLRPHPIPAYRFWRETFVRALGELGHTVLEAPGCDWAEGLTVLGAEAHAHWRAETWNRMTDWIRAEHARQPVDLFLSYLYPAQVEPGGPKAIRERGIPTVNFFCDHVRLFDAAPRPFREFDLNWVPEAQAIAWYRKAGFRALHAAMPCWVAPALRSPPLSETFGASFVGTRDRPREELFGEVLDLGAALDLWGVGWSAESPVATPEPGRGWGLLRNQWELVRRRGPKALASKLVRRLRGPAGPARDFSGHAKGVCSGEQYFQVLRGSTVSVGVNRFEDDRSLGRRYPTYSRLRDIEAPMVGAAYLTERAVGLDLIYEEGREIEVYSDAAELADKLARLSADPERRRRLRQAGQRRALSDHTVERSLARILESLSLA